MAIEITWLGRTCFRIRGREGTVITDPVPADSGYRPGKPSADVVTLSRASDPAFAGRDLVSGEPRVLDAPGEYEVGGILLTGVSLPLPEGERNVSFVIELEGIRVGHLGLPAEGKLTPPAELEGVDVLLMPVGGGSSLTGRQAADLMTAVDPSVVIPMYYKTEQERLEIDPLERFLSEAGIRPEPQPRFTSTKNGLPEHLTVTVLQPRGA
jgi:L-ascorbate metabolism protein UlaG (beta-lactamase superfamily)